MLVSAILNSLAFVLGRMSDARLWTFVQFLAWLSFDVLGVRRKLILANLDIAFGETKTREQKLEIARLSTAHTFLTFIRFLGSKYIYPRQKVTLIGGANLTEALREKKGAYILGLHIGDFELMGPQGTKYFHRTNVVVKALGDTSLARWMRKRRAENGEFEIEGTKGERQLNIFRALDKEEMIGFMVDQRRNKGLMLPLFGKECMTNTSLFYLWLQRPSPIVPVLNLRTGVDTHDLHLMPKFEVVQNEGETQDEFIYNNSLRMNQYVESAILRAPEQYFWMHNRWKLKL